MVLRKEASIPPTDEKYSQLELDIKTPFAPKLDDEIGLFPDRYYEDDHGHVVIGHIFDIEARDVVGTANFLGNRTEGGFMTSEAMLFALILHHNVPQLNLLTREHPALEAGLRASLRMREPISSSGVIDPSQAVIDSWEYARDFKNQEPPKQSAQGNLPIVFRKITPSHLLRGLLEVEASKAYDTLAQFVDIDKFRESLRPEADSTAV